tara:strand:+ start:605 stop:1048 length:444 start_codon:yes stop_codon:yes gene_type:complete
MITVGRCLFLSILILLSACSKALDDETVSESVNTVSSVDGNAVLSVIEVEKGLDTLGVWAGLVVKNNGDVPVSDLEMTVSLISNNTVIETIDASVSDYLDETLAEGAVTYVKVYFSVPSSHDSYDQIKTAFSWKESYTHTDVSSMRL